MENNEVETRVGDYTIDGEHGRDATGVVYQATHLVLPRKVLLKISDEAKQHRVALLREACLLEALCHPGVPRVYETGVLADKRPWVAFERHDCEPLPARLALGALPIAELVVLLRDVATVLHHAHSRGVVHRKLTAETVARTPNRALSICVRRWDHAGTVDSMLHLDAREDVYALGAIAFRALTGCLHTPSVSATEWCPSAPGELTALIDVMLDPNPRVRPTSEEARERAAWLATTTEMLEIAKPRWTPPNGLDPEEVALSRAPTPTTSFSIRIARKG